MNGPRIPSVAEASEHVACMRARDEPAPLADALETFARSCLQAGDVSGAAVALDEAGALWTRLGEVGRAGNCLLLAAASFRLAMQPEDARRILEDCQAIELPARLRDGFEVEACEQALDAGRADDAWQGFTRFLDRAAGTLDAPVHAQLLQRRAAAAAACRRFSEGAGDLLRASQLFAGGGRHDDAEACALAAAAMLAEVDAEAAERIVAEVGTRIPSDGAAAARRGLVGGTVAKTTGAHALALQRFDAARQGALDATDPVSYLTAAVEAARVAEAMGDPRIAYARLATAWGTLSEQLGRDRVTELLAPELTKFRDRLGAQRFAEVKRAYEAQRKRVQSAPR